MKAARFILDVITFGLFLSAMGMLYIIAPEVDAWLTSILR